MKSLSSLCIVTVLSVISGCSAHRKPLGFRVGLVTPGSIADAAWNSGAYRGLRQIADSLHVTVSNVEAGSPGAQEEALRSYAAQGYQLVFAHGFEFQGAAERVSHDYPNTVFIITSGERQVGNVAPLVFRIEEATYLCGMVAGGMTKTGKIGFIGGIELPPIKRGYEGWSRGARAMDAGVESRVIYLNSFDDAAAGREAAIQLMGLGVDMLHHNADAAALGIFQAVKDRPGVYVFGANADQHDLAPGHVLGSAVIDLPRALLLVAREVHDGRFTPHVESFGLASGVVKYVPDPALADRVPAIVARRVAAAADSIAAGTLIPVPDSN